MDTPNEGSSYEFLIAFNDETSAPVVPATAQYKIDDVTTGTLASVLGWTQLSGLSQSMTVVVPASLNNIINAGDTVETRLISVKFTYLASDGVTTMTGSVSYSYQVLALAVPAVLLSKVQGMVADSSAKLVYPDDYITAIETALQRYSRHRPDTDVVDITGANAHDYPVPSGWVDQFSVLVSIEYPVGIVPAVMLDEGADEDYMLYQYPATSSGGGPTGLVIRLIEPYPSPVETFRVTFTIPRTYQTIAKNDVKAFCQLAASFGLEQLANAFAQLSDSTIGADAVNYRDKSDDFAKRAKRFFQLYKDHMGVKDDGTAPAAAVMTSTSEKFPGGAERLTHTRWARERR